MSHYPHARDWYELCDEMGILVMDELTDAWGLPKPGRCYVDNRSNAYGFHTICAAEYEWAKQDEACRAA